MISVISRVYRQWRATRRGNRQPNEILVIGAGLGGLASARLLSKTGIRVHVVEKNPIVGGYASGLSFGGVEFDVGAQDITILGRRGIRQLDQLGLRGRLQSIHPHGVSIYPGHRFVWDAGRTGATLDYLVEQFPQERVKIEGLFREMAAVYQEMDRYLTPERFGLDLRKFPHLMRWNYHTTEAFLREMVDDETLISLLGTYCLFYQGMPMQTLSALHFIGMLQSYFDTGAFYAEGGIGALSDTLRAGIESQGGTVSTGVGVQQIRIEEGRARGVILEDGRSLDAAAIVANIDPRVVGRMLGEKPDSMPDQTRGNPAGPSPAGQLKADHLSRCQLFAVLDDDAPELPFVTFYAGTYDKAAEYRAFAEGAPVSMRLFCRPGSPRTMSVALPAPYRLWRDAKDRGEAAFEEQKLITQELVREMLVRAYPDLTGKVRFVGMVTPVDLERFSGNIGGTLYGADAIPQQSGMRRASIVTQTPGLFLTGQWVAPGGSATLVLRGAALTAAKVEEYIWRSC